MGSSAARSTFSRRRSGDFVKDNLICREMSSDRIFTVPLVVQRAKGAKPGVGEQCFSASGPREVPARASTSHHLPRRMIGNLSTLHSALRVASRGLM
jgi:hypothetical protein